jgi:hypothetical protein
MYQFTFLFVMPSLFHHPGRDAHPFSRVMETQTNTMVSIHLPSQPFLLTLRPSKPPHQIEPFSGAIT